MSHAPAARHSRLMGGLLAIGLAASALVAAPLAVIGGPASPADAAATQCSSTPFTSSASAHKFYRVPTIAKASSGVIYAFAELRPQDTSDDGNFDIVKVSSTNNGCSWSAPTVVFGAGRSGRSSNPVAVTTKSGSVLVVLSYGSHQYFQISSSDGFKSAKEITFSGSSHLALSGPTSGIVLTKSHVGRIVIPFGSSTPNYGAVMVYSDDNGVTWTKGAVLASPSGRSLIEGSITERSSGDIYATYRDRNNSLAAGTNRYYTLFKDGGATTTSWHSLSSLKITSVSAAVLTGPGTAYSGRTYLSAPSYLTPGKPDSRRVMAIYTSTNGGSSFSTKPYQVELDNNPGSYSDMVTIDGSTLGLIYEGGLNTYKEKIRFVSIGFAKAASWTKVTSSMTHEKLSSSGVKIVVHANSSLAKNPWGTVTLTYTNTSTKKVGSVKITLGNQSAGLTYIHLPKLGKGSYSVKATYSGTPRISGSTMTVGTLKI